LKIQLFTTGLVGGDVRIAGQLLTGSKRKRKAMKAIHLQGTSELTKCGLKIKGKRQVVADLSQMTCHRCKEACEEKKVEVPKSPEEKKIVIPAISKQELPANVEIIEDEETASVLPTDGEK